MKISPTPAEVAAANRWWDEQKDQRKVTLHKWMCGDKGFLHPEIPGQLELLEGEP